MHKTRKATTTPELGSEQFLPVFHTVTVNYPGPRSWQDAVRKGAPETKRPIYEDTQIPHAPPVLGSEVIGITLVSFERVVQNDQYALDWAYREHDNAIRPAGPWVLLAMAEEHPNLNAMLDKSIIYVSSLESCQFIDARRVPYLAYVNRRRELRMARSEKACSGETWFAFIPR